MPPRRPRQSEGEALTQQDILDAVGNTASGQGNIFFGGAAEDSPVKWKGQYPTQKGDSGFQGSALEARPGPDGLTDVTSVLRAFYRLDAEQLRRYQLLMFAGGFYGATDIDDVRWGQYDDASYSAWATATEQAARQLEAGEDVTVQKVIELGALMSGMELEDGQIPTPEQLAAQLEEQEEPGPGEIVQRQGDLISILLSDPNELRSTMDTVASATLGRKANPEEQQMLIGFIHELQRKGQTAQQTAEPGEVWAHFSEAELDAAAADPAMAMGLDDSIPEPEDVTVEYAAPNPQAVAESMLRQENPAEAGAHDIAIQFANLMDMMGESGFPRQTYGGGV